MVDRKTSALPDYTAPVDGDYLPIVVPSEALAVNRNKRLSIASLKALIAGLPLATAVATALAGKAATTHAHSGADVVSGTVAVARIGTGTKDATTYYRGDGTFALQAGGSTGPQGATGATGPQGAIGPQGPGGSGSTTVAYRFGTLLSDTTRAADLYANGVRRVHLELGWDAYEPTQGAFSTSYRDTAIAKISTWKAAGMTVTLGPGLQYPPGWALNLTNGRYQDQFGATVNQLNLPFSQAVRDRASIYFARINSDLGINNFDAIRIGSGGNTELLFPDSGGTNKYYAFDAGAQGGNGRASGVAACPFPGWLPGSTSITQAQVATWYSWYLDALGNVARWQIGQFRAMGYTGQMQVLMPGLGVRPNQVGAATTARLDGTVESYTVSRGAAWHLLIDRLYDLAPVIYNSSLADNSGVPTNNLTATTDGAVALTDSAIEQWSAMRWLTYAAKRYALTLNGENPGFGDAAGYGTGMLDVAVAQMIAGGWEGLYWAHEFNLYDGTSGITAAQYGTKIAATPARIAGTGGAAVIPPVTKTAAYTATTADRTILGDTTAAAFTITLPTAVGNAGREFRAKWKAGANALTIASAGGTIDGQATLVMPVVNSAYRFESDGVNWFVS